MQGDGVCRFYEECEDTDIIGVVRRYAGLPERRLKQIPPVGGWKAVCGWDLVDAEEWCCVS